MSSVQRNKSATFPPWKLQLSPDKICYIEKKEKFHHCLLKHGYNIGMLCENSKGNADRTHIVVYFDTGKTLGFIGNQHANYAEVISGGEAITMMVRIMCGVNANIHPLMIVFQDMKSSYSIRGVPDSVPAVCYQSSSKCWMTVLYDTSGHANHA